MDTGEKNVGGGAARRPGLNPTSTELSGSEGGGSGRDVEGRDEGRAGRTGRGARATGT